MPSSPLCAAAIARVASHPSPRDSAAASARGKGSAARGARAPSSSQVAIKYSTSPSVATMCINPGVLAMISFIMESTSTRSRLPDCDTVSARARGEGAGAGRGRRGRRGRRDGTSKALLVLPPPLPTLLPTLSAREGRRRRGGGERESHLVLVVLREYIVERLFLSNVRIVPLDSLLRRHPRDPPVFAPAEIQRVALHRRRALYEHIEQFVVGRVFGVQEEQELLQLIAIELAVLVQVKLLEPAAQARAAARVAHCRTQPGAAKGQGLAGTTLTSQRTRRAFSAAPTTSLRV